MRGMWWFEVVKQMQDTVGNRLVRCRAHGGSTLPATLRSEAPAAGASCGRPCRRWPQHIPPPRAGTCSLRIRLEGFVQEIAVCNRCMSPTSKSIGLVLY